MNSKKRTQILYDDPNSMFKASKTVYLHDLQGSTLKTRKPTLVDVNDGLKTAELMSKIITKLSNLDSVMEFFSGPLQFGIQPTFVKDASIAMNSILPIIKQLMKSKRTSFNEDDVFSIKTLLDDIVDKRDAIISRNHGPALNNIFAYFIGNLDKLINKFNELLPYLDVSGKIDSNIQLLYPVPPPPPPPYPDDAEFQDAIEPPDEEEEMPPLVPNYAGLEPGPPPPIIWGNGRFKVLSKRMSKIQHHPFKRFI